MTFAAADNQQMFLTLNASTQSATKCYSHLTSLADKHASVPVDLAGVVMEDDQILLTVAVDFGARDRIAEPSEEATNGYAFVIELMESMFDFLPQYTVAPDAEARAAAEAFQSAFAAQSQTRRAV